MITVTARGSDHHPLPAGLTVLGHADPRCSAEAPTLRLSLQFARPDRRWSASRTPAPYAMAITGGSSRYQGAKGEVRAQPVPGTRGILTFHLQD